MTVTLEDVRKKRQESEQQLKIVRDEVKKLSEKLKRSVKFVLLGLQTDATKFTIVVDLSGSMKAYETLLVEVCDRIIGAMQEGHSLSFVGFRIVGSSPDIQVWPTNRKPIAMDDKGKEAAILHVKGLFKRFDGGTPTYDALLAALDMPGETVVLVTDGIPSYPVGLTATQIVDLITTANHGRKQIHAVGIGKFNENPVFIAFLEKLSRENGGDFASFSR